MNDIRIYFKSKKSNLDFIDGPIETIEQFEYFLSKFGEYTKNEDFGRVCYYFSNNYRINIWLRTGIVCKFDDDPRLIAPYAFSADFPIKRKEFYEFIQVLNEKVP